MVLSLIGTNCSPLDASASDAGATPKTYRSFHRISTDITAIKLVYSNMTGSAAGVDGPANNPFSIKASVERVPLANRANINVMTGTLVPVQFGGTPTGNLSSLGILESDLTPFTASAGDIIMVRAYVVPSGGTILPFGGGLQGGVNTTGLDLGEAIASGDTAYSGNMTLASDDQSVRPIAILGQATDGKIHPSVAIVGDSIAAGTGDNGWFQHFGNSGFLVRACWQQDVLQVDPFSPTVPIGYVQCSRGGEQIHQFVQFAQNTIKPLVALYATDVWSFLWGNDGGLGVASIKSDLVTLANWFTSRGKTFRTTTHSPGNTSTDGWRTISGQTISDETVTNPIHAFLRDGTSTGFVQTCTTPAKVFVSDLTALCSVNSAGASSTSPDFWPPMGGTVVLTGSCTSANTGYIADTTKTIPRQTLQGYTLYLTSATNGLTFGTINWNNANLIVTPGLNSLAGDTYEIRTSGTFDGGHPATVSHQRMAKAFAYSMLTQATIPSDTTYNSAPSNEVSTIAGFIPVTPVITAFSGMSTFPNPQVSLTWGAGNWLRILVQMMTVGGAGNLGTFQTVLTIAEAIPGDASSVPTTIILNNTNLPLADAMAFGVQYKFRLIAQGG